MAPWDSHFLFKMEITVKEKKKPHMSVEDSQSLFFATFYHILFLKGPVLVHYDGSRKCWWSGPVRKGLNLLGPLEHYCTQLATRIRRVHDFVQVGKHSCYSLSLVRRSCACLPLLPHKVAGTDYG